jgi:hypothetical protein
VANRQFYEKAKIAPKSRNNRGIETRASSLSLALSLSYTPFTPPVRKACERDVIIFVGPLFARASEANAHVYKRHPGKSWQTVKRKRRSERRGERRGAIEGSKGRGASSSRIYLAKLPIKRRTYNTLLYRRARLAGRPLYTQIVQMEKG